MGGYFREAAEKVTRMVSNEQYLGMEVKQYAERFLLCHQ